MSTNYFIAAEAAEMSRITGTTRTNRLFRKILFKKLADIESGELTIAENGQTYIFGTSGADEFKASIEIINPAAYSMITLGGGIGAAEAYFHGFWISKDLVSLMRLFVRNKHLLSNIDGGLALLNKPRALMYHMLRRNTRTGSKKNIEAHYDLSNDFYGLFLDETMNYSSGIFPSKESTLLRASIEKMDRICKKLDLKPDDHLLEIGSGWGGMAVYAAKKYGCRVTTITVSQEQFSYAVNRVIEENLEERITVLNKDYRDLGGTYDKIVSVEMIEAVGYSYIPEFFRACDRLLREHGIMVLQGITMNEQNFEQYRRSVDFIQRFIFPGACLISVSHVLGTIKKKTILNLVDLEDITPHYADTLKAWRIAFNKNIDKVRKLGFSEQFIRMWEYYFSYCEGGFRERYIGDVQMTFAKPGNLREPILGVI
ncbi:class I SAM-dependent methyltransferase [candidate division KSB1 bacterium]